MQSKKKKPGGYKEYYNNGNNGHHVLSAYLLYSRIGAKCFIYTLSFDPPSSPKQWMLSESPFQRRRNWGSICRRPSGSSPAGNWAQSHLRVSTRGWKTITLGLSPACCLSVSVKGDFSLIYCLWLLWGYHSRGEGLQQRSYDESLKRLLPGPLREKFANAT